MLIFLHEFLFGLGMVLLFGLCGAGAIASFAPKFRFGLLAMPLAGLLLVPLGTLALYVVVQLPLRHAALAAILCCVALAIAQHREIRRVASELVFCGLALVATVAILVLTIDASTIWANGPAFGNGDGVDNANYATMADWLLSHDVVHLPQASPDLPYQSFPAYLFAADPRFGSFCVLAIIAWLHGTTGLFSYDMATVIVLACGALGVGAVFARSAGLFALLVLGLLTSHWLDYAETGFFGKLGSYPAALYLAGLVFASFRERSFEGPFFLVLLTAGAAMMHSGTALAVLIAIILGGAFVLSPFSFKAWWRDYLCLSGLLVLTAPIASGMFARPHSLLFPDFGVTWDYAVSRMLDLDNQGVPITGLSASMMWVLVVLALLLWAGFLVTAFHRRDIKGLGLIGGPAIVLAGCAIMNRTAPAFQMLGYFYPALLCGACCLIDKVTLRTTGLVAMLLLTIGLRQPRVVGDVDRYIAIADAPTRFTEAELDGLAAAIGTETVEVDVVPLKEALVLLSDFGRRNLNVTWSIDGWQSVLRYRKEWQPVEPAPASKILKLKARPTALAHYSLRPIDAPDESEAVAPPQPPPGPPREPDPPAEIARFPEGLMAPGLYFAGVSQDEWLSNRARAHLSRPGGSNILHLAGEIPDFSAKITTGIMRIAVDDVTVLARPETSGHFDLSVPIPKGDGARWITLEMTGADQLPAPDGRLVSVRLTSIGLERRDD
jgi:hypothetical protein